MYSFVFKDNLDRSRACNPSKQSNRKDETVTEDNFA